MKRLHLVRLLVPALSLALGTAATAGEQSRVPNWDARGVGPLPWQGIACLDATQDAGFVAVGTISSPGDPNVILLDASGKLIGQYRAGHRWIGAVAVSDDGRRVAAVCTSSTGQAGDKPMLCPFAADQQAPQATPVEPVDSPGVLFHYGDHSNHLGIFLDSVKDHFVLTTRDGLCVAAPDPRRDRLRVSPAKPGRCSRGRRCRAGVGRLEGPCHAAFRTHVRFDGMVVREGRADVRGHRLRNRLVGFWPRLDVTLPRSACHTVTCGHSFSSQRIVRPRRSTRHKVICRHSFSLQLVVTPQRAVT